MLPEIRYTDSGGLQIAYQTLGDGPFDVVLAFDWASNLDLIWQHPSAERFIRRIASFSRLILFDLRGMGLSDPVARLPPLEDQMGDVAAVMDAVGSDRASLIGHGSAGQLGVLFAATYPERTRSLVTINAFARLARADDYPPGMPGSVQGAMLAAIEANWGTGAAIAMMAPELAGDEHSVRWWAGVERMAGTPRRAAEKQRLLFETDVRHLLPSVTVPTLVVQSQDNRYVVADHAAYLTEHIRGARQLLVPGGGHWPWASRSTDAFLDELERFLTGTGTAPSRERVLATVAFTDIVRSTELAADVGDRRWRELIETHDSVAAREIEAARGRLVKSTGDGLLATFDGPARGIRAVQGIGSALAPLGLTIRGGLHTGEVESRGDDVTGMAVVIASRVADLAGDGEVLASSTVKDLVAGSGIAFVDRGEHELKGVPDVWHLYAAVA